MTPVVVVAALATVLAPVGQSAAFSNADVRADGRRCVVRKAAR
jgi:hypothetical protein